MPLLECKWFLTTTSSSSRWNGARCLVFAFCVASPWRDKWVVIWGQINLTPLLKARATSANKAKSAPTTEAKNCIYSQSNQAALHFIITWLVTTPFCVIHFWKHRNYSVPNAVNMLRSRNSSPSHELYTMDSYKKWAKFSIKKWVPGTPPKEQMLTRLFLNISL